MPDMKAKATGSAGVPSNRQRVQSRPAIKVPVSLKARQKAVAKFILEYLNKLESEGKMLVYEVYVEIPNADSQTRRAIKSSNDPGAIILRSILNKKVLVRTDYAGGIVKSESDFKRDTAPRSIKEVLVDRILTHKAAGLSNSDTAEKVALELCSAMIVEKGNLLSVKTGKGKTAPAHDRLEKERTGRGKLFKPVEGVSQKGGVVRFDDYEFRSDDPENVQRKIDERLYGQQVTVSNRDTKAARAAGAPVISEKDFKTDILHMMLNMVKAIRNDNDLMKANAEKRKSMIELVVKGVLSEEKFQEKFVEDLARIIEENTKPGERLSGEKYKAFMGELIGLSNRDIREIVKVELTEIPRDTKIFGDVKESMHRAKEIRIK